MPVTLTRKPFTPEERAILIEAVMTGNVDELEDIAMQIAEKLPDLLKRARLPDTYENRRAVIELVLTRWAMPKTQRQSHSYRRMARR